MSSKSYNRKDKLYQQAKDEGYRSRAAYKLKEMDSKYGLLKPGFKVFDLGAWPGGWLQVASKSVGPSGLVVGIDLVQIEPLPGDNIKLIHGDAREEANIENALSLAGGKFNLLLSDMSPKLTGIKECDQAGTVACAELALYVASQVLDKMGNVVMKVFKGNDTEIFIRTLRTKFKKIVRSELDSTRKTSNEFYVLGFDYLGN